MSLLIICVIKGRKVVPEGATWVEEPLLAPADGAALLAASLAAGRWL